MARRARLEVQFSGSGIQRVSFRDRELVSLVGPAASARFSQSCLGAWGIFAYAAAATFLRPQIIPLKEPEE
jgi:hypothetical protein